jgi:hypothetical protein
MAQGITLYQAIRIFQGELGCGDEDSRESTLEAVRASIEYLLLNGGGDILREWVVPVRNGRFTFPRDLETPVKYRCGRKADFGFGAVQDAYFPYSSQSISSCCGYGNWDELRIAVKPNKVYTQFQPPKQGLRLVATTKDDRDVGKKIMINGNRCHNPLKPTHFGHKTSGELLTIYKEDDPNKKYGAWIFDEITGVVKDETCAYVMLSGIDTICKDWYFLSHYTPDETIPRYTEGELFMCGCGECDFEMHILGRVSPNVNYCRDEDILPINSYELLRLLAKRARYDETGDLNEVNAYEQRIQRLIKKQVAYQQPPGRNPSFALGASGATLTNI